MDNVAAYVALVRELEAVLKWPAQALRLEGHARGASTWHHQHLQETMIVPLRDLAR
ncbi:hypothetical protein IAE57_10585 [Stenotrophomonas sp. S48]|uniref:hypothetical protein n=1 Tax=unclassified Stenotrophomonas TaxID=196198 RepID=UPI0018FF2DC3|nr:MULTISPECIES: hypothetical protein [unclassified Stenotrophomonas]MBK0026613.1 hypothetical protein [Stenotrophomonas sp. S48]MBK0047010.1 hypothetical protein [Stenotrophomonas sp. S49]